ncbi:MAG: GldG family protein [Dehalococcoidales bacterium]|nr:GldG family protein [Dehalococcoidales bacterium]
MKNTSSINQYSGLIALLGLVALFIGFIVMILLPEIRYAAWGTLLLGVLLMGAAFIIDSRRVGSALTGRRGRFSTGTTVMASIFIGITLLANAISIGNYHRFDFTGVSQFTLTQQTKDVLSKLDTPVQALFFSTPQDPYGISGYISNLLNEYRNYSDQLTVETIDPDEHPDQARQYGVTQYETVVFTSGNLKPRLVTPQEVVRVSADQQGNPQITGIDAEHPFTSAILEVTGIIQKKVYFLTGHGEHGISADYSNARQALLDNLYKVETLDLVFSREIPEDASALIIAGPKSSLGQQEIAAIAGFLENDGNVLFLINPNPPAGIRQLFSPWGIDIEDGTIIDPSSYVAPSIGSPSVPRLRNLFGLAATYFPGATAMIPQEGFKATLVGLEAGIIPQVVWTKEGSPIQMISLLRTSQDSWLEKDFDPLTEPVFNDGVERKGPLDIGFFITTTGEAAEGTNLIILGDSDFASNQHFRNGDNAELFLNTVNFITTGQELISIERKVVPFRRLIVGPEVTNFIRISSIGLLPLVVLITGGVIWWRRR